MRNAGRRYGILLLLLISVWFYFKKPGPVPKPAAAAPLPVDHTGSAVKNPATESWPAPTRVSPPRDHETASCWDKINSAVSRDFFLTRAGFELRNLVGRWYYAQSPEVPDNEISVPGKFLLALAKAGLLEGKAAAKDDDRALALLNEVIDSDPSNSAPYLFAAVIENKRGDGADAQGYIEGARRTGRFDSYVPDFSAALFSQVQSPSDLVAAVEVWSQVPIPDYLSLESLLRGQDSTSFAQQMLSNAPSPGSPWTQIHWLPIEYAVGRSLLPLPERNQYLPYDEVLETRSGSGPTDADKIWTALNANCDVNVLAPLVDQLHDITQAETGP